MKKLTFKNDTGDATLMIYSIFTGIQVVYASVHMDYFDVYQTNKKGNYIEIHHCLEGRIEHIFEDEFFYLTSGDMAIAIRKQVVEGYHFPLRHYHGVIIAIDIEKAPKCFCSFMEDVNVQPLNVAQRFCSDRFFTTIRGEKYVEHIFSEVYTISEEQKLGYLKIKVLELFYILSQMDVSKYCEKERFVLKNQVVLAKEVVEYLTKHLDKRITVSELAKEFHVSESYLKNLFKSVYGMPVFSYIRVLKMQSAAYKLIHTNQTISVIASEVGYSNESKFSAAFKDVMGETPTQFRKAHSQVRIV